MMEADNGLPRKSRKEDIPVLHIGSSTLTVDFQEPDDIFTEKAKNELRETPEVIEQAQKDIRVLMRGEPDLYVPDDDEYYKQFLRPCKWYPKSAFELMKRFYRFRLNHSRICDNLLPSKAKNVLSSEIFVPLPDRSDDGCRILLINAGKKWNPKLVTTDELLQATMLALEAAMAEPATQIAGVHVIINLEGFALTHVTYITPSFASLVADWVQRCVPCRLKGIHIINQPFIFNMVFALFKPFLQEKTRKRIHFHGKDRESLMSHIGRKALPTSLGGELIMSDEPIGEEIWRHFCWFEDDFIDRSKYGYVKRNK